MGVPIALGYKEDDASGAQVIDGGLRFDSAKSHYLTRTPSSAGNRRTFTWSGWIKNGCVPSSEQTFWGAGPNQSGGTADSSTLFAIFYNGNSQIDVGSAVYAWKETNGYQRDYSGWYHYVLSVDTNAATAATRLKFWINNVQQTFSTDRDLYSAADTAINNTTAHNIGRNVSSSSRYFDGEMTQVYFIDGQALDPSYFGYTDPLTNTWRPKKYKPTATPNNGTTWSSYLTTNAGSNFDGSYPVTNAFDNSFTTKCLTANNANGTTTGTSYIQFNSPSSFSGTLKVICENGNAVYNVTSGTPVLLATQSTGLDEQLLDCGSVTGISSIRVLMSGGSRPGIGGIYINGVGLIDSLNDTGGVGTNGFYLPLDGNTPIGQDQSGRGNNWTPVNFGGSNTIEKATGALPILNTDGGGKVARVGVRTDSNASSLVLALPLVGIKSDFSNKINSGTTEKAITVNGSTAGITTISNFYGGSWFLNANTTTSGNHLSSPSSNDFVFGTGDFTVEAWIYRPNLQYRMGRIAGLGAGAYGGGQSYMTWTFGIDASEKLKFSRYDGTEYDNASTNTVPLNKWVHVAVTRQNGTLRHFIDGSKDAETTFSTDISLAPSSSVGSDTFQIGQFRQGIGGSNQTCYFDGYIQDLRVYKGVAKYTQNFIPASTDPDILPDTPSGVAYSSNVALVPSTDGAVAFDGSGDYLSLADNVDLDLGNSNFTIEGFVYVNSTSGSQQTFVAKGTGANNQASYHIALNTSGNWVYYLSSNGSTWDIVSAAVIGAYTPNAWQHIALVRSGNTFTPYLNGIAGTPTTSSATLFDSNKIFSIGADDPGNQLLFGFTSNVHVVKGTALYTSNFTPPTAPITSVANTKLLCCKSQTSATAYDVSPGTITANGNAVASNFNPFTVNINTQRGQESGYATLNPLQSSGTLSNGNNSFASAGANWYASVSTIFNSSGKWYCEYFISSAAGPVGSIHIGIVAVGYPFAAGNYIGNTSTSYAYRGDGTKYVNTANSSYGASFTTGDLIGVAFDADAGTLTFYKNGISQGVAATGISGTYAMAVSCNGTNGVNSVDANFGQKPFKFPPPTGFQPLALANTPRPTIVRPDQYVGIVTYTGNSTDNRKITVGFKPDFVWFKSRSNSGAHALFDSIRGTAMLDSQATSAESAFGSPPIGGYLNTFERDGFTLKNGSTNNTYVNENAYTYVSWAWKAGGNSSTFNINDIGYSTASAAGLTAGTITPTGASVNTKSGFSIITYTGNGVAQASGGASIPHGLGKVPSLMIVKSRDTGSTNWSVWHSSLTAAGYSILLNDTGGQSSGATAFNSTLPTSSLFYVGQTAGGSITNTLNDRYVAYLWAEIPGFSKFGSYTGNGSSDGPMIVTGFRPRWVMVKASSSVSYGSWRIYDSARGAYNVIQQELYANLSNSEDASNTIIDFLSNGFKLRSGAIDGWNGNGATIIYAAFAESPSFNLYGGQANAR